jgi:hypothetical protein
MPSKATTTINSDSENPVEVSPRNERIYTLTPLGRAACRWIERQEKADEEFAYFCPGCLRVLASCSCLIDER